MLNRTHSVIGSLCKLIRNIAYVQQGMIMEAPKRNVKTQNEVEYKRN